MKKFMLILLVLINLQTKGQDTLNGKCWTPEMDTTEFQNQPWYSNNDYLENFLDSMPIKYFINQKKFDAAFFI